MEKQTHVVMLPWLAFGHMIPFFQLSLALAKQGLRISFVSTPKNIARLPKVPPQLAHLINFVPLPLPKSSPSSDNYVLPNDAESTIDLQPENVQYLKIAYDLLAQPFKQFVSLCCPDWIIADGIPHWAVDVAQQCGIPLVYFSVFAASVGVFFGPPEYLTGDGREKVRSSPESMTVPPPWVNFPSSVAFRIYEANGALPGFYGEYLDLYGDLTRKRVFPVGLLPAAPFQKAEMALSEDLIFNWLGKQKERSVVFAGFGTECKLSKDQVYEIAYGLEMSELAFIWVIQKPEWACHDLSTATPLGFTRRTAGRGMVHIGWAPQREILAHASIGGSLFHSGWGSVIETLQHGHCLVALPMVVDQGLNARMLVDKGLAVEVDRSENGAFSRDGIAKALRHSMISKEGENLRNNAKQIASIFGDQERYLVEFAKFLECGVVVEDENIVS